MAPLVRARRFGSSASNASIPTFSVASTLRSLRPALGGQSSSTAIPLAAWQGSSWPPCLPNFTRPPSFQQRILLPSTTCCWVRIQSGTTSTSTCWTISWPLSVVGGTRRTVNSPTKTSLWSSMPTKFCGMCSIGCWCRRLPHSSSLGISPVSSTQATGKKDVNGITSWWKARFVSVFRIRKKNASWIRICMDRCGSRSLENVQVH